MTGRIKVNYCGQICKKHPLALEKPKDYDEHVGDSEAQENIFSIGDCCFTPAAENKSVVAIEQYAGIVAHNVYYRLAGTLA